MRQLVERTIGGTEPGAGAVRRGRSVTVNLAKSPLAWLHARGHVDARQFEAGERLRADFETAALGPRVTMRWDAAPASSGRRAAPEAPDPTLAGLAAKRRFDTAIAAVGPGLADVLWRVVCAGEGLAHAERAWLADAIGETGARAGARPAGGALSAALTLAGSRRTRLERSPR